MEGNNNEILAELDKTVVNTAGVVNAFKAKYKDQQLLLSLDTANQTIVVNDNRGTIVTINPTIDGSPYKGLKKLSLVNESDTPKTYPLIETKAGETGVYEAEVPLNSGKYIIYDGTESTGEEVTVSTNPVSQTVTYYTETIKLKGADGINDVLSYNGIACIKPDNKVIVRKNAQVTVKVTEGNNKLSLYTDSENSMKGKEEALQGYSYNVTKGGTIEATFTTGRAYIAANPASVDFGDASVGYGAPDKKTIKIRNIGNIECKVKLPESKNYLITDFEKNRNYKDSLVTLQPQEELSFSINPKLNLPVGEQDEVIPIYIDGAVDAKETVKAFFRVNDALTFGISGNTHLMEGESTTLTPWIFSGGAGKLTYQWRSGSSNLATTSTLTIQPSLGDTTYTLTITDASGVSVSHDITVTVEAKRYTFSITPDTVDFGAIIKGGTIPDKQTILITNTGNDTIELSSTLSGEGTDNYDFTGLTNPVLLPAGQSVEAKIQPKESIKNTEKKYDCTGTITAKYGEGFTKTITQEIALKFSVYGSTTKFFIAEPSGIDCGEITQGYTEAQAENKNKQEIKLTYYGQGEVTVYSPGMSQAGSFIFKEFGTENKATFTAGTSRTITVFPKQGLAAGSYDEEVVSLKDTGSEIIDYPCGLKVKATVNPPLKVTLSSTRNFKVVEGEYVDLIAEPAGGTGPYTYAWTEGVQENRYNTQSIYPIPTVGETFYKVTVTDATGMTAEASHTVIAEKRVEAASLTPQSLTFDGMSEGYTKPSTAQTVTIKNTGNVTLLLPPRTETDEYVMTGFEETKILIPGNADTFTVQPKTGRGKGSYKDTIDIIRMGSYEPIATLTANMTVSEAPIIKPITQKIQKGDTTTLKADVTGGIAPYTYLWSSGATTQAIKVAPEKTTIYTVTVTDASGTKVTRNDIKVEVTIPTYLLHMATAAINFGTLIEGYTITPEGKNVVLTNKGTKAITLFLPETKSYVIRGLGAEKQLAVDESVTVSIEPKLSLPPGEHKEKITFRTNESATAALTANFIVKAFDESLSIDPGSLDFGNTTEGYTKVPSSKTVVVTNKGNTTVTVKVPAAKNYKIAGFESNKSLAVGEKLSFEVTPNKGLAAGEHKESIKIETQKGATSFIANMKVAAIPTVKITGVTKTAVGISTTLTANVTGGTTPYSYKWSNDATTSSISVTPKEDTEYTLTVTDNAGIAVTEKVRVTVKEGLSVFISGVTIINEGDSTTLSAEAAGGIEPYTYSWNTLPEQNTKEIEVSPGDKTTYEVTVRDSIKAVATAKTTVKISKKGVPVAEPTYTLLVDKESLDYGTVEEGYVSEQLKKEIKVTNKGNANVTLKVPGSVNYKFTGIDQDTLLKPGESLNIGVMPKGFLSAGTYGETIVIRTSQNSKAELLVKFTITESSKVQEAVLDNETIAASTGYEYGDGNIQIELDNEDGIELIEVMKTADYINTVLTEEEKKQVAEGSKATLRIRTQTEDAKIPQKDKELTEDALEHFQIDDPELKFGMYVDIVLEKRIDGGEWKEVKETEQEIELGLQIPDTLKAKGSKFYLMRVHDGTCAQIAQWNAEEKAWIFSSNQFSTYSIIYTTVDTEKGEEVSEEKQGLTFCIWGVLLIILFMAYIAVLWLKRDMKLNYRIAGAAGVIVVMVVLAVIGSCKTDTVMAVIGIAAVIVINAAQYFKYALQIDTKE